MKITILIIWFNFIYAVEVSKLQIDYIDETRIKTNWSQYSESNNLEIENVCVPNNDSHLKEDKCTKLFKIQWEVESENLFPEK